MYKIFSYEALWGWCSGKVFLDIIFKMQENLLIMISNTIEMLFIVYSITFLQKKCVFPHVRYFTLIYGPFYPDFDEIFCCFFKCSLNCLAHALQLDLNKVWYNNFVNFQLQSMSSKIERAFEKTINMFLSSFCRFYLYHDFFCTYFLTLKKNYFIYSIFTKFMWWIPFKKISMTVIKSVKNQIFKKVYLPLKPTWRSCFFLFHSHDPKPKQNHQISISRAKIRSTQSQTCVKRNTDVNTGDLKILHKKMSK